MQDFLILSMYKLDGLVLNESQEGVPEGMMRVSGTLAKLEKGVHNKNGREYDWASYAAGIRQIKEKINQGLGLFGELEHPKNNRMTIDNNLISHKIEDINFNESTGEVTGTFLLLDTPNGKIAQSIVRSGGAIRPSSRAVGAVRNKVAFIKNMFTFDIVGSPGFENAAMWLKESEEALSYVDSKIVCDGLHVPEGAESWATPLFESVLIPLDEQSTELPNFSTEHNFSTSTQNTSTMEHKLQELKSLLESTEGLGLLRGAFRTLLIEAEELAPTEDVINEQMKSKYLPLIEAWFMKEAAPLMENWVKTEYSKGVDNWIRSEVMPMMESYMIKEFAPTLVKFVELRSTMNESEAKSFTFGGYVAELRHDAAVLESIHETVGIAEDTVNEAINESTVINLSLSESEQFLNESEKDDATLLASDACEKIKEAGVVVSRLADAINESLNEAEGDEEEGGEEGKDDKKEDSEAKKEKAGDLAEIAQECADSAKELSDAVKSLEDAVNESERPEATTERARMLLEAEGKVSVSDAMDRVKAAIDNVGEKIQKGEEALTESAAPTVPTDTAEKAAEGVIEGGVAAVDAKDDDGKLAAQAEATTLDDEEKNKEGIAPEGSAEEAPKVAEAEKETATDTAQKAAEGVVNESITEPVAAVPAPAAQPSLLESVRNALVAAKTKSPVAKPQALNESEAAAQPIHLRLMPEKYQSIYANLNESQKAAIDKQAEIRLLESEEDVERFWLGRDFNALSKMKVVGNPMAMNEGQAPGVNYGLLRAIKGYNS